MKKLLLGSTVAVFAAMTLTAGIASARNHGEGGGCRPEITFAMLDTDGNGAVTALEITAKAMMHFAEQDTNDDGFLDAAEILAAGQARHPDRAGDENGERAEHMINRLFEHKDANQDGLLSPEEMRPDRAEGRFERTDTDENGEISQAEFDAAKAVHGERRDGRKKGPRGCDDS